MCQKFLLCLVAKSYPTLLRAHGLQSARLLCPWVFLARILECCHFLRGFLCGQMVKTSSAGGRVWTLVGEVKISHARQPENAGVGCRFLLQGIFVTQALNPHLQPWQAESLPLSHQGSPPEVYLVPYSFLSTSNRNFSEEWLNPHFMDGDRWGP